MSSISTAFDDRVSVSSPIGRSESLSWAFINFAMNKIADRVFDDDLYESLEERKPSISTMVDAAIALSGLSPQDRKAVQIEPFSGELGLVWASGRAKRVKAIFGPERGAYSVYHEHMLNGRVVDHHLEPQLDVEDPSYLRQRLAWLHT